MSLLLPEMSKVRCIKSSLAVAVILAAGAILPPPLRADQIEMQNGDRYVGTVLSLNANTLVLHSEVLGDLTLPRSKVAQITLRPGTATNIVSQPIAHLPASATTRTNAPAEEL